MARRGWSRRLLVEDCVAFDIANLGRAGVFRARPGTLWSTAWKNAAEQEILCAYFWVELTTNGRTLLHVSSGVPSGRPPMHYAQDQIIEIVQTPLYFGPRPWFRCPGALNGVPCLKRCRILYFPPGLGRLGCRRCLYLIHKSTRQHDKRIDALLKRTPLELQRDLLDGNTRQKLLAVQASAMFLQRLRKKAAHYCSLRQTPPPTVN
jgi:hypothetical protein